MGSRGQVQTSGALRRHFKSRRAGWKKTEDRRQFRFAFMGCAHTQGKDLMTW
jgi:hypothetical protein